MRSLARGVCAAIVVVGLHAAAAPCTTLAQPATPAIGPQVDAIFARYDTTGSPGCVVGVGVKGVPVLERAYGMADLEHDVVLRPDAVSEAGSVSKQFTAAAVLLLARDGALSLDDPVRKHIPELHPSAASVTIRQLLQHTAGLRDWGTIAGLQGWPRTTRAYTHAHVLDILGRQSALNFAPGTDWSYSNSGYNLAAILVARVSGMSFAEFSRTRLFQPLGMRDTSWRDDHQRVVRRRAIAYRDTRGTFTTLMPFENIHGNGGLLTTVRDLLRWNDNFATHVIGDEAFVREQERTAILPGDIDSGYGLGLFVAADEGRREVSHSGATAGYRAFLTRYPAEQLSVAVLCNVSSANAERLAHQVADLYLDPQTPSAATAATVPGDVLRARAGVYRQVGGPEVVVIEQREGALRLADGPALEAISATRMRLGAMVVEFGVDGIASKIRVSSGRIRPRTYERVERATPVASDLQALAGHYRSDDVDVTIELVVDDGRLKVKRFPDDDVWLTPLFADAFGSTLGTVRFTRDLRGRVTDLHVSTDRAWDVVFTRTRATVAPTATRAR